MPAKLLGTVVKALSIFASTVILLVVFAIVISTVVYPMYLESLAEVGMEKDEVLANFNGKDYRLVDTFLWCDDGAWYGDCEAVANSESVEFLILKIGIDNWLLVGFDSAAKVSFVGRGDT